MGKLKLGVGKDLAQGPLADADDTVKFWVTSLSAAVPARICVFWGSSLGSLQVPAWGCDTFATDTF